MAMNGLKRQLREILLVAALAGIVFAAFCAAPAAVAQGSRKDDIVLNAQGRPMAGATVRVCTSAATGQPCSPLALIYSDPGLTQALANPTTADGLGNYSFYAAPGRYEVEISGPGITTKQLPNVILPSDPTSPTFTTVTTTSGISAFSLSLSGNLTVSGSTAVTGSLTVGGAPVPSTGSENQWTASQHIKGPIPWRDFTAYMKDSNSNPVNCTQTQGTVGAFTTGSISLGTPTTLTLAAAKDFKTGCGVAIPGAGPLPTIVTPPSALSISSISRSGSSTVTIVTTANHNLLVGSGNGEFQGVQVSGCSISAYNGTFPIQTINDSTHLTYTAGSSGTDSPTGCSATVFFGYAHGIAGSTTYNYQIVAVDQKMGYTAASGNFAIANGNATLSKYNYNHLMWAVTASVPNGGPTMWLVYSDKGAGGAKTCVGSAFTNGFSDMGFALPCPPFAPTNPPASAGAQALNTTITAGGGTTTLTLANAASAAVTTANVYHDESSFLTSCVNDAITDESGPTNYMSGYGCYIPAGNWGFNGPMPTATTAAGRTTRIRIAGKVNLSTMPWFIEYASYFMEAIGGGATSSTFDYLPHPEFALANQVPAAFVNRTNSTLISGFSMNGLAGDGIWSTGGVFTFRDLSIGLLNGAAQGGAPIHIENSIGGVIDRVSISGNGGGGLPDIWFTISPYNGNTVCCVNITNLFTTSHGVGFSSPGGNGGGAAHNTFAIRDWLQETGDPSDVGLIQVDNGPNAPGQVNPAGAGVAYISLQNVYSSDSTANSIFAMLNPAAQNGVPANVTVMNSNLTNIFGCAGNTTANNFCYNSGGNGAGTAPSFYVVNGPTTLANTGNGTGVGFINNYNYTYPGAGEPGTALLNPLVFFDNVSGTSQAHPAWSMVLPPPNRLSVTGTGAGSLGANTYCIGVSGSDLTGNETNTSNIVCQNVGASSSISLQWFEGSGGNNMNAVFSGFNLYYCTTSTTCSPNNKLGSVPSSGHNPVTFTFTSTTGSTGASPQTSSNAQFSWLSWDAAISPYSCFFCANANTDSWPVGFGVVPTPSVGVNVFTKLGVRAGTQYQATETSAPSGVASVDQMWADSAAHQWKKIENNGAAFAVAGTLSGTTGSIGGSALTAGQCASGTVSVSNSTTSMTVSVSPNTYPGDGFIPWGYVSANGTVTVKVCAELAGTPTSSTYNVRVIQ